MKKKFSFSILFFLLFSISNSFGYEKMAKSSCVIFMDKIIENYDRIKDHYFVGYTEEMFGFTIEKTWNSNLISEGTEGKKSLGDTLFKRDTEGNIFIQNVFPNYVAKVNFRPGNKITRINNIKTKLISDKEINEILDNKDKEVELTYINKEGKEISEKLKTHSEFVIQKNMSFKINSLNSINNQTFETEALIEYYVSAEMFDGIQKDDYSDMDNDMLFKITKETFLNTDEDGDQWYSTCGYNDDELNKMQLYTPGLDVKLLNLSFKSEITSDNETIPDIYDENTGHGFESIDLMSKFEGLVKIKNKFDLRNFPFDKQRISFNFSEVSDSDVYLTPFHEVYANLDMLKNDDNFLNGWKLVDTRVIGTNYQPQRYYEDKYSNGLSIILEVERESSYYVYKIILPIILILMVCWSVIWITPKELESRLTVTIVCLLSLIAYNFVIDKELPKLEYLTVMDWIIFTSYVFATIPNILCVISFKLFTSNKKLMLNIENKARIIGPLSYITIVLLIIIFNVNAQPENSISALRFFAGK